MKIIRLGILIIVLNILLTGCGKKLTDKVTQTETQVKVGTTVNLESLFTCEDGITIGFNNADSFNPNQVGSYSLDTTITDGKKETKKTYIVKVYDDEPPQLTVKDTNIVIYENDTWDPKNYIECTDNSGEEIEVNFDDSAVDTTKAGEYKIKYTASDSSNNTGEAEATITVKQKITYKKLKTTLEEIIKKNNYDKLKINTYKNDNQIEISVKNLLSFDNTKNYIAGLYISIVFTVENKKINPHIYVLSSNSDMKEYLRPKSLRIESKKGAITSDKKTAEYDYDYDYNYSFQSSMHFQFTKIESLDKFCDIIDGKNLTFTTFTSERDLKHKCTKSDIKKLKQLRDLYKQISEFI